MKVINKNSLENAIIKSLVLAIGLVIDNSSCITANLDVTTGEVQLSAIGEKAQRSMIMDGIFYYLNTNHIKYVSDGLAITLLWNTLVALLRKTGHLTITDDKSDTDEVYMKVDNKSLTPNNNRMQRQEFATMAGIIIQEFNEHGNHRLIHKDSGEETHWAGYTSTCYMRGHVGYTGYHMDKEGVLPANEFVQNTSVGLVKKEMKVYKRAELRDTIHSKMLSGINIDKLMDLAETALNADVVYDETNEQFEVTPK